MANGLKIASMNVRGLAGEGKRRDIFNWLKRKQFTIYCLQDIHINSKNERVFFKDWDGEAYISSISSESRGLAILFKKNLDYKILNEEKDNCGNLLMIEIQIQNFTFFLAVIYGPNTDSPTFYSNLKNRLLQTNGSPIICCGDWNLVLEFKKDTYAYIRENNINAKSEVMKMVQSLDLIDIWRARNPDIKKYTWVSGKRPSKNLTNIREVKFKGAMIRAKAEAYYNFEKSTRYFCNLKKRNYTNKVIHRLKHKGRVITNQQEILDITKHFYSNLLQSKRASNPLRKQTLFINESNIEHLTETERNQCEGMVTYTELG